VSQSRQKVRNRDSSYFLHVHGHWQLIDDYLDAQPELSREHP
jgi:hypothetical protein